MVISRVRTGLRKISKIFSELHENSSQGSTDRQFRNLVGSDRFKIFKMCSVRSEISEFVWSWSGQLFLGLILFDPTTSWSVILVPVRAGRSQSPGFF